MDKIDARGLACPEPVMLTRELIKSCPAGGEIVVDNSCAVENVTRFAKNNGYSIDVKQDGTDYHLTLEIRNA